MMAGVLAAFPYTTWHSIDGYAYGVTIGLALGRVGCYAVGEHFGG